MEYPSVIIYPSDMSKEHREFVADEVRSAYLMGQHIAGHSGKPTDPLAGYSNLTEAIRTGKSIDWERMEGVKVKCVNHSRGTLRGELKRNTAWSETGVAGWYKRGIDYSYINAFVSAWGGEDGWTLWVEGEIPMRRKTADGLKVGTYFTGKLSGSNSEKLMCVASGTSDNKHVRYATDFRFSYYPASEWIVLEEHGPSQKPEGK